jgi:glycosyltransferase involved in cell wall biosynthesis
MPEVSIILPTYNRAHSLGSAVQSILEQTYSDFELIVVDDGSTDDTSTYIQEIDDQRLTYVVHNTNKGAAAARNTGMRLAVGDYIAFLDSDDTWNAEKLEKQLKFLKEQDAVIGGCVSYYRLQFLNSSTVRKINIEPDFYHQSLKGCNLSPGSTLIFKKECLNQVGFQDESLKRFEDWEWQIRFARFYKWAMVPEVLADIKVGHTVSFDTVKQSLIKLEELTQALPNKDKKIINMAIYYELFYAAFKNRLWGQALRYLSCSFFNNPRASTIFITSLVRRTIKEHLS